MKKGILILLILPLLVAGILVSCKSTSPVSLRFVAPKGTDYDEEMMEEYASSREYLDIELIEVEDDEYLDEMMGSIKAGNAPQFGIYDFDPEDEGTNSAYYVIKKGLTGDEMDDIWDIITKMEDEDEEE